MTRQQRDAFVGRVGAAISSDRIQQYYARPGQPRWEALANYAWNVALCEAFYPLLHAIEIVLRNSLDRAIQTTWSPRACPHIQSWLDSNPSHLNTYGQQDVDRAKQKLLARDPTTQALIQPPGARPKGHPDLVAALDFGFWTGLLHRDYKGRSTKDLRLWPHLISLAFPYCQHKHIEPIGTAFNDIRKFRNRVFHHEPIWRRDLAKIRVEILDLVAWSSPESQRLVEALDRVPDVLHDDFRRELRVVINRECRR